MEEQGVKRGKRKSIFEKIIATILFVVVVNNSIAFLESGIYADKVENYSRAYASNSTNQIEDNVTSRYLTSTEGEEYDASIILKDITTLKSSDGEKYVDFVISLEANTADEVVFNNPKFEIEMPEGIIVKEAMQEDVSISADGGKFSVNSITTNQQKITLKLTNSSTVVVNKNDSLKPQITVKAKIEVENTIANKVDNINLVYYKNGNGQGITCKSPNINIRTTNSDLLFTNLRVENYDGNNSIIENSSRDEEYKKIKLSRENQTQGNIITIKGFVTNNFETEKEINVKLRVLRVNKTNSQELKVKEEALTIDAVYTKSYTETIKLPTDLQYSEEIIVEFKVSYNDLEVEITEESKIILATEVKDIIYDDANMTVEVEAIEGNRSLVEGNQIQEGSTIRYNITVINKTNMILENVEVKMTRLNDNSRFYDLFNDTTDESTSATRYGKLDENWLKSNVSLNSQYYSSYYESNDDFTTLKKDIEKIPARGNSSTYFETVISNDATNARVKNNIGIKANKNEIICNTKEYQIVEGYIEAELRYGYPEARKVICGTHNPFYFVVANITDEDIRNINVKIDLTDKIDTSKVELFGNYDKNSVNINNNILTFNIPRINAGDLEAIEIFITPLETEEDKLVDILRLSYELNYNIGREEVTTYSNEINRVLYDYTLKFEATSKFENNRVELKDEDTIKKGEAIQYKLTAKNNSKRKSTIDLKGRFNGVKVKSVKVNGTSYQYDIDEYGDMKINNISIDANDEKLVIIDFEIETKLSQILIEIDGSVNTIEKNWNDSIKLNIQAQPGQQDQPDTPDVPDNPDQPDNPETPDQPDTPDNPSTPEIPEEKTYSIEGNVWLDENKDNKKGKSEKLLKDIKVRLIKYEETYSFVKDEDGNVLEVLSDENGNYKFDNLKEGTYVVIFEFDSSKYEMAEVRDSKVKYYETGKQLKHAITNDIKLQSNITDINLGLRFIPKFDLNLEKYITKIITTNKEGKETKTFEDESIVKEEISKKNIVGTDMIIEYTIKVTNNGELSGYVTEIVDDLPETLKFSSELNTSWAIGTDGKLYNRSLKEIEIKPGETKEIKLVLTKKITNENAETIINTAKINKYTNSKQLKDIDQSNNESSAQIVISIKTGEIILEYSLIVIPAIALVILGAVIIKRKIIDND